MSLNVNKLNNYIQRILARGITNKKSKGIYFEIMVPLTRDKNMRNTFVGKNARRYNDEKDVQCKSARKVQGGLRLTLHSQIGYLLSEGYFKILRDLLACMKRVLKVDDGSGMDV